MNSRLLICMFANKSGSSCRPKKIECSVFYWSFFGSSSKSFCMALIFPSTVSDWTLWPGHITWFSRCSMLRCVYFNEAPPFPEPRRLLPQQPSVSSPDAAERQEDKFPSSASKENDKNDRHVFWVSTTSNFNLKSAWKSEFQPKVLHVPSLLAHLLKKVCLTTEMRHAAGEERSACVESQLLQNFPQKTTLTSSCQSPPSPLGRASLLTRGVPQPICITGAAAIWFVSFSLHVCCKLPSAKQTRGGKNQEVLEAISGSGTLRGRGHWQQTWRPSVTVAFWVVPFGSGRNFPAEAKVSPISPQICFK